MFFFLFKARTYSFGRQNYADDEDSYYSWSDGARGGCDTGYYGGYDGEEIEDTEEEDQDVDEDSESSPDNVDSEDSSSRDGNTKS